MDTILKNNIEGIILKWSYQVQMVYFFSFEFSIQTDEVLGKDSAEELNKGNNPGPMTEIKFWDAKVGNHSSSRMESLTSVAVHQPRVPLRADEGGHNKKDGVHSQCH